MEKIDLKEIIMRKASQASKMVEQLISVVPVMKEFIDSLSTEQIITLEIPPEIEEKIRKGIYTITSKKGVIRAVVRETDTGEIVKHLDLKTKDLPHDFDLINFAQYAQVAAINNKLESLAEEIIEIQQGIDHVLIGLQNDRVAQYLSGEDLYINARLISDPGLQRELTVQALMRLNNAYYQLSEEVKHEIGYLKSNYNKEKLKIENTKIKEVEAKIQNINTGFDIMLKAIQAQASIYYECGEVNAMLHTLNVYGELLGNILDEDTAEMLYQFDRTDKKLIGGTWYYKSSELPKMIETINAQYLLEGNPALMFKKNEKGEAEYVGMYQLPQAAK